MAVPVVAGPEMEGASAGITVPASKGPPEPLDDFRFSDDDAGWAASLSTQQAECVAELLLSIVLATSDGGSDVQAARRRAAEAVTAANNRAFATAGAKARKLLTRSADLA